MTVEWGQPSRVPPPHQAPPSLGGPSGPRRRRGPGRWIAVAVALLVALAAGGVLAYLQVHPSTTYEALAYSGPNPFTSPVGADDPSVAPVANAGGPRAGDTPELYAADPARPACDESDLLTALQADPVKAGAWAGVLDISADQVPELIGSLSAVVVRSDTAVVDHGFANGAVTTVPAVLAPGTAVLIDSRGVPTVKCRSGDPLTTLDDAPSTATVIVGTPAPITVNVVWNPVTRGPGTLPRPPEPPLRAHYDYDGSVLLSDGRIINADGTVQDPKAPLPKDAHRNPDGSYTLSDGTIVNPDGTPRKAVVIPDQTIPLPGAPGLTTTVKGFTIRPDGTAVDATGAPLSPQPKVVFNYDGTATIIGGNQVSVWKPDGSFVSKYTAVPPQTINPDGSIDTHDGKGTILNPDGSTTRTPVTTPGGSTVQPNGGDDATATSQAVTSPGGPAAGTGAAAPACTGPTGPDGLPCPPAGGGPGAPTVCPGQTTPSTQPCPAASSTTAAPPTSSTTSTTSSTSSSTSSSTGDSGGSGSGSSSSDGSGSSSSGGSSSGGSSSGSSGSGGGSGSGGSTGG